LEPGTYFAQVVEVHEGAQPQAPKMLTVPAPIVVSGSDLTDLVLQPFAHGKVSGKFRAESSDNDNWKQMTVSLIPMRKPEKALPRTSCFACGNKEGQALSKKTEHLKSTMWPRGIIKWPFTLLRKNIEIGI
jgi:hypothetical protein